MTILRAQRTITALRDLGPYVLLEILLPGGTLVALLLWLSQRYMGGGLGGVRQHVFLQKVAKPAAAAIARFRRSSLCAGCCAAWSVAGSARLHRAAARAPRLHYEPAYN